MMRKVVSLTTFLMLAVLSCLTAPAVYADEPPQPYLKKTIERDETVPNLYNATIETFLKGTIYNKPIDVMVCVSNSQSMADGKDDSPTSEKNAYDRLIDSLSNYRDARLSVVIYGTKPNAITSEFKSVNASTKETLKNLLNTSKFDSTYDNLQTATTAGRELFDKAKNNGREKYCIIFMYRSLYSPSYEDVDVFSGSKYTAGLIALHDAYYLKQQGVKIYTIWIGKSGTKDNQYDYLVSSNKSTKYSYKNLLDAISSNFPDAYWNVGNSDDRNNMWSDYSENYKSSGYTTAKPASEKYHKYVYAKKGSTTGAADVIKEFYNDIVADAQTIVPSISLDSPSVKDLFATGFKLPNGASATCTVAPCIGKTDGKFTWGSETDDAGVTASAANSTVTVSGFNFNDNCVYSDGSSTNVGKKLIVRYPFIIDTSTDISGIGIKTTDDSSSGIFDGGNKKGTFDTSDAKADLVTITVTVTGLREGDNAVVNLTKSGSTKSLRYVVVGDADGRGTIDVNFQEPNKSYTASVELSRIYNKVDSQTETLSGNHTFNFACTPNFEVNVSHAEAHYQIEY